MHGLTPVLLLLLSLLPLPAMAQWTTAAPGIEYSEITDSGHRYTVARVDRNEPTAIIDTAAAQGRLADGRELVADMAANNEDTLLYWDGAWGPTRDVVIAVNGSFFDLGTGIPHGGQVINGWYAKQHDRLTGSSGFSWKMDTTEGRHHIFIGECITHRSAKNIITYANEETQPIDGINLARPPDALIIYTPHFDDNTRTDAGGVEVLVELPRPLFIINTPSGVTGTVAAVMESAGSTPIPFDHVVLSASAGAGSVLLANAAAGDEIVISMELAHFQDDCSTRNDDDWFKTQASIGGNFDFLEDGVIDPHSENAGATSFRSRTAVAYNDNYIFFVVVDEVSGSTGVNMQQLGEFCRDRLGATHAVNQDGGGSSRMWIGGEIVNHPSDPSRTVANAIMMVSLQDADFSTAFRPGDGAELSSETGVRLGPGDNYAVFHTAASGSTCSVQPHGPQGVWATGAFWWKCWFIDDGLEGWVEESVLNLIHRPDMGPEPVPDTAPDPVPDTDIDATIDTMADIPVQDADAADAADAADLSGEAFIPDARDDEGAPTSIGSEGCGCAILY